MLEGGALHCRDSDLQEMSRDSRSDLCLRKFVQLWGSLGGGRPRGGQGAGGLDGRRLCPQGGQQRPAQLCPSPTGFAGPPDPLHGSSLYQKVRAAAQVSLGPGSTPAAGLAPLCLPGPRGWGAHGLTRGHLSALCPPPPRTWGPPCSLTPGHLRLPPSLPGSCPQQVCGLMQLCHPGGARGFLPTLGIPAADPGPPCRHGRPVQAPEHPPGLRLQQGTGPHR